MPIQDELIEHIMQADRSGAVKLVMDWAAQHDIKRIVQDVLEPALVKLGEQWEQGGKITLAHGYVAAKVAEDILNQAYLGGVIPTDPRLRTVVIGNIEDDYHALGRKMVGIFLQADGWKVHDLGNDCTPVEFVDRAVDTRARIIGASAMMLTNAMNIRGLRAEIDRRGLRGRVQLAVGGAIFNLRPSLVQEVGGDGSAENAFGASALMERLWERSLAAEAGS